MRRVVTLINFNHRRQLLIVLSRKHERNNVWTLPGGKLEKLENEEDALRREILEELSTKVVRPIHYSDFESRRPSDGQVIRVSAYFGKLQNRPTPSSEIIRLDWLNRRDDSKTAQLSDASRKIINSLARDGYF